MYHSSNALFESKHNRKTIVIYGFGKVGKEIIRQRSKLKGQSHVKFLCVSRKKIDLSAGNLYSKNFSNNVMSVALDLDYAENIKRVASLCSMIIVLIPTKNSEGNPSNKNVDNRTRLLTIELLKKEPKRKKGVYISTTGVYGNKNGNKTYETSSCIPTNNRSFRRLDAETKIRKLNFHILRVPGIYSINRLPIERLLKKIPVLHKEEDVYTNHIHESDLARAAYLALFRGRRSRITNVVDNSDLKMSDYMDLIASATGIDKPERASFAKLNQLAAKGLISNMAMSFLQDSRRVKSERLVKELGINLIYSNVQDFVNENRKQLSTIRQRTPSR
ncbi:SDR family NAD(P)-dependent oxidoreductase [Betaproteobacteria bacterium]|nr:SDR family NAD(P)-dependent oxidoreductase [Betaproteobacteria bacterium]